MSSMMEFTEGSHTYYVYVITNKYRSTYYIGMCSNLGKRLRQHQNNIAKDIITFASKYQIEHLVYYEEFSWVHIAIAREKEIKAWRRDKKLHLIRSFNPKFEFLEHLFLYN